MFTAFRLSFALMAISFARPLSCEDIAPTGGTGGTLGSAGGTTAGGAPGSGGTAGAPDTGGAAGAPGSGGDVGAAGGGPGAGGAAGRCALPFETSRCVAAFPVYTSLDGACVATIWGGCSMENANRFNTLAECMATCGGPPPGDPCPAGRPARQVCIDSAGPGNNCWAWATVCARPCTDSQDCESTLPACRDGVCQAASGT